MVFRMDSTLFYDDVDQLLRIMDPHVNKIVGSLVRNNFDHSEDCKQDLKIYIFEAFTDKKLQLTFQQLINKVWWRAADFVRRDPGFNFWAKHLSLPPHYVPSFIYNASDRAIETPTIEDEMEIKRLIKFSERELSERDHLIFLLAYEGFPNGEICDILGGSKEFTIRQSIVRTRKKMFNFLRDQDSTTSEFVL